MIPFSQEDIIITTDFEDHYRLNLGNLGLPEVERSRARIDDLTADSIACDPGRSAQIC